MPEVESPIPDTIGVGTIIGAATAGGILLLVLAIAVGASPAQRTALAEYGIAGGFVLGLILYMTALAVQLLCRQ
jgi:hypothetical protein